MRECQTVCRAGRYDALLFWRQEWGFIACSSQRFGEAGGSLLGITGWAACQHGLEQAGTSKAEGTNRSS
jgi:hypothetical protein